MNVFDLSSDEKVKFLFKEGQLLQEEQAGLPCNKRMEYSVSVLTRHLLTVYTLWNIMNPAQREDLLTQSEKPSDFASAFVLLRGMYEAYLNSYYLLEADEFAKCRNVIMEVSDLHNLRERHILSTNMRIRSVEATQLPKTIAQLVQSIKDHDEFGELAENIRNYVSDLREDNKNLVKKKLEALAEIAEILSSVHLQYYKYFSNYTHSNPLSVRQIGAVRSPREASRMMSGVGDYCVNFLGRALDLHRKVSNSEGFSVELSNNAEQLIRLWYEIGKRKLSDWGTE